MLPGRTVRDSVQDLPPMFKAKNATPIALGVPEMETNTFPVPLANVPPQMVAVRPVTPVDETVRLLYVPPLPPVYGT